MKEELNYERKKLSKTIDTMKIMLESEKDELKDLKENFKGEYEELYSSSSILDTKLLYVAITRALHELDIVYTKNISKPLEKWIM